LLRNFYRPDVLRVSQTTLSKHGTKLEAPTPASENHHSPYPFLKLQWIKIPGSLKEGVLFL